MKLTSEYGPKEMKLTSEYGLKEMKLTSEYVLKEMKLTSEYVPKEMKLTSEYGSKETNLSIRDMDSTKCNLCRLCQGLSNQCQEKENHSRIQVRLLSF